MLAAALANAILYCCALPLWEGFDEVDHYAYIETLVVHHKFPVLDVTRISQELRDSLNMTPLSHFQCESLPGSISFEQWSRMSDAQKQQRKAELHRIPRSAREQLSDYKNYEAQQVPLAYILFVPLDLLFGNFSLPARILSLRLCGTVLSCLFLYFGVTRLLNELGVCSGFRPAMLATAFTAQMLWASVAHVGNDVLAIPLVVWFLACLATAAKRMSERNVLMVGIALALGLLAKAYFLAFVPVFLGLLVFALAKRLVRRTTAAAALAIVLMLAGPWYWHNVALYGSLSGTQQSVAGIGWRQAMHALPRIGWLQSSADFSHWSLWTGNYSFLSFSRITLDVEIWLLRVALIVYLVFWRKVQKPERWLWAACACFALSLVYQTCVTWVESRGLSRFAEPWYAQGVIVCVWVLCFLGLARWRIGGRWIAAALVLISAWIAAMTYLAKLLPYYAGGINVGGITAIWRWWISDPWPAINTVTLAPAPVICCLLILFNVLLVVSTAAALKILLSYAHSRAVTLP